MWKKGSSSGFNPTLSTGVLAAFCPFGCTQPVSSHRCRILKLSAIQTTVGCVIAVSARSRSAESFITHGFHCVGGRFRASSPCGWRSGGQYIKAVGAAGIYVTPLTTTAERRSACKSVMSTHRVLSVMIILCVRAWMSVRLCPIPRSSLAGTHWLPQTPPSSALQVGDSW